MILRIDILWKFTYSKLKYVGLLRFNPVLDLWRHNFLVSVQSARKT